MKTETLGYLESAYITITLQDCLDQLFILSNIQLSCKDSDFSIEDVLKETEQNAIEESDNEKEGTDANVLTWQKASIFSPSCLLKKALAGIIWDKFRSFGNLTKLGRDHKLLELLMKAVLEEMEKKGTYTCLVTVIIEEKLRKEKFKAIMIHMFETDKKIFELMRQCAQMAKERPQNWEAHNEIAGLLKSYKENLKDKSVLKLTREKKLTDAHVEQELNKMVKSYDTILEELKTSEAATKTELDVTKTMCTFLLKRHTTLDEMLEYWADRHATKVGEAQSRLDDVRNLRTLQWDRAFYILQLYISYTQVIEEYNIEKQEMERRPICEKRMVDSVVKIQTWWRFTMVRKQLGQFRLKRKGKRKGK